MDLVFTGIHALPVPGETTSAPYFAALPGGKGANQAAAAARLGADVWLVGCVGDDAFGELCQQDLAEHGVRLDAVRTVPRSTGVAAVLIDVAGENSIVISPGANAELDPANAAKSAARIAAEIAAREAIVLACLEVPLPTVVAWAHQAAERGWRFVLNPAPHPPGGLPSELLALAHVVTPNEIELRSMSATGTPAGADVVVTLGGDGARVQAAGGESIMVPPFSVTPADTTGAGDAFNAGLVVGLARGWTIEQSAEYGCAVGALATKGLGARGSLPTDARVREFMAAAGRLAPAPRSA